MHHGRMEDTSIDPSEFVELTYDWAGEEYRQPNGELVKFPKMVTVRIDGEVSTHKLSYTRAWMGQPTSKAVPILRIDGDKYLLNGNTEDDSHIDFEVATDCVLPCKA
jgi:hypothetical protein